MRRIPIVPTLLVLAAVAEMVHLGFWQIDRLHEKEALLASYAQAQQQPQLAPWPRTDDEATRSLYRRSAVTCVRVTERSAMAGRNTRDEAGLAQTAQCSLAGGGSAKVVLGWSRQPVAGREWRGGAVVGTIAPGPRLVADPPLAGLEANERPDPSEIPNNHLSYAVQWFLFALTALVIYAVALRRRLRDA
jgi:surfeit locus 1 family protein